MSEADSLLAEAEASVAEADRLLTEARAVRAEADAARIEAGQILAEAKAANHYARKALKTAHEGHGEVDILCRKLQAIDDAVSDVVATHDAEHGGEMWYAEQVGASIERLKDVLQRTVVKLADDLERFRGDPD